MDNRSHILLEYDIIGSPEIVTIKNGFFIRVQDENQPTGWHVLAVVLHQTDADLIKLALEYWSPINVN